MGESVLVGFVNSQSRIPPLLGGEGRGEGETDVPTKACMPIVTNAGELPEGPCGFNSFIVSGFRLCPGGPIVFGVLLPPIGRGP